MGKMNTSLVEITALEETLGAENARIRINGMESDLENLPRTVFMANVTRTAEGFIPLNIEVLVRNEVRSRIDIQLPSPVLVPSLVLFTEPDSERRTVTLDINIMR
ncbi:hypothetical protein [Scopulibacillus cellulosilyticus]|uniref:SpoOM protein n=1 Tax=Scopulibacillus cellulosilyticus TaxID=2665665 RepID=A0ABW2Q1D8_9BACL